VTGRATSNRVEDGGWEYTVESYSPGTGLHIGGVQGECPACGSRGLFVGSGGYLTCSWQKCPNPVAPSEALGVKFDG